LLPTSIVPHAEPPIAVRTLVEVVLAKALGELAPIHSVVLEAQSPV
jgi:hypothetical protein